jgi:two-component system chemotaxis response regulator CheB
MTASLRVLVVEDSLTVRKRIVEAFENASDFEVIGEASDGKRGIELCERRRPDVVTMDMMLPVMTGLAATEYIMAYCPTPILIVSASTNRGELFRTYDALAAGAVDVLEKPLGSEPDGDWERQLLDAARRVARIRVITHPRARLAGLSARRETREGAPLGSSLFRVVAIGASTGGPAAVLSVLRALPASFPLPILLVVHISEPFGRALAEWLDGQVGLTVRTARDGERLPEPADRGASAVLMAPPERHLELRDGRLLLTDGPPRHSCRPSVDVLFESLAREMGRETLACLLTGMGRDGASGLLALRESGGTTVAQDESTSVVYGMPGEAVRLGAASHVLPLPEIGLFLGRSLSPARGARK